MGHRFGVYILSKLLIVRYVYVYGVGQKEYRYQASTRNAILLLKNTVQLFSTLTVRILLYTCQGNRTRLATYI